MYLKYQNKCLYHVLKIIIINSNKSTWGEPISANVVVVGLVGFPTQKLAWEQGGLLPRKPLFSVASLTWKCIIVQYKLVLSGSRPGHSSSPWTCIYYGGMCIKGVLSNLILFLIRNQRHFLKRSIIRIYSLITMTNTCWILNVLLNKLFI